MSLTSMLYNAPLYQPVCLPPPKSNVIVLCSSDDVQHISEVFKEYNIQLVISWENNSIQTDYDLQKIFNYNNCCICIFGHQRNNNILRIFANKLFKLNIRHKYICIPIGCRRSPEFLYDYRQELEQVFSLLCDDESREIFVSTIKSIITGTIGYIKQSEYFHYFHPETIPNKGDIIIDGGVGRDISFVRECSKHVGNDGHIYSFEPVCYFDILEKFSNMNNTTLFQLGLWNKLEDQIFTINRGGSSVVDKNSNRTLRGGSGVFDMNPDPDNTVSCKMTTIDSFISEYNINKVDMIKLDVEGSEKNVLLGGVDTIIKHRPKLLISVYHKLNDLFELPLYINDFDLNYRFYLGHHSSRHNETVLYAVPD